MTGRTAFHAMADLDFVLESASLGHQIGAGHQDPHPLLGGGVIHLQTMSSRVIAHEPDNILPAVENAPVNRNVPIEIGFICNIVDGDVECQGGMQ